jgi:hypothetical protein
MLYSIQFYNIIDKKDCLILLKRDNISFIESIKTKNDHKTINISFLFILRIS